MDELSSREDWSATLTAGARAVLLPPAVRTASAWAPRGSDTPTKNSARDQSSVAPGGALEGVEVRSNSLSILRSAWNTGTLNRERWRSSVAAATWA